MMLENESNGEAPLDPSLIVGKDLERHFELQDALFEFSAQFRHEEKNDRGLVIVGAAFLDTLLFNVLVTFLVDDEKEVAKLLECDRPLGAYGNRVRAAFCLGLIPATVRNDLGLVGKIRNQFAHNLYASFEDEKVRSWCESLKWHKAVYMEPPSDASARDLFYVDVHKLVGYLDGIVCIARSAKRSIRE
jgi:hypothetical protein